MKKAALLLLLVLVILSITGWDWYIPLGYGPWYKITGAWCDTVTSCYLTGCTDLWCNNTEIIPVTVKVYNMQGSYCRFGGYTPYRYTKSICKW